MPVVDTGQEFFLSLRVSPSLYQALEKKRLELFDERGVTVSIAQMARTTLAQALGVVEAPPAPSVTDRAGVRRGILRRKKKDKP